MDPLAIPILIIAIPALVSSTWVIYLAWQAGRQARNDAWLDTLARANNEEIRRAAE